jgi:hypothetical protein
MRTWFFSYLLIALMRPSGPSSRKIIGGCFVPSHWIRVSWFESSESLNERSSQSSTRIGRMVRQNFAFPFTTAHSRSAKILFYYYSCWCSHLSLTTPAAGVHSLRTICTETGYVYVECAVCNPEDDLHRKIIKSLSKILIIKIAPLDVFSFASFQHDYLLNPVFNQ